LKRNGWKYSVDMEGFGVAKELHKKIVFLETIAEQIKVLENISSEKIMYFLKQADRWNVFAGDYAKSYLKGDLEQLRFSGIQFPTRHYTVINQRDGIFYERMRDELELGEVVAFLGAPHLRGMCHLLLADGYQVQGPWVPQQ